MVHFCDPRTGGSVKGPSKERKLRSSKQIYGTIMTELTTFPRFQARYVTLEAIKKMGKVQCQFLEKTYTLLLHFLGPKTKHPKCFFVMFDRTAAICALTTVLSIL